MTLVAQRPDVMTPGRHLQSRSRDLLSADAAPGQIRGLLDQGARDYLTKPLDVKQRLALVDDTLVGVEASRRG